MSALDDRLAQLRAAGRLRAGTAPGLGQIALARTAEDPDRIVIREGDTALTRGRMTSLARALGGALLARGIGPGAVLGFQLPNWWEACVINLTAALFGYRLLPLLPMYCSAELNTVLPMAEPAAVFAPADWRGTAYARRLADLTSAPPVFTVRGDGPDDFAQLTRHPPATPTLAPTDDAKLILFTSGSTGRPKGVIHSHSSIHAVITEAAGFWAIGPTDTLYVPSPIAHIGGSIYAFEFPWITGCQTILAETWDPAQAAEDITTHRATFMAGATPFLQGLIATGRPLPSLKRFICGGASVQPALIRQGLHAFPNATVSRAYGSTEVPLVCPGLRTRAEAEAHPDTDGECTAQLRLLANGEIAVRTNRMFHGYLAPEDDTDAFTEDGFFRMGDTGQRTGTYLTITGRVKDIVIRKGENISPLEIETALLAHPNVQHAAIIGIPDPDRGEMVAAFVVPAEGTSFSFDDMTTHLTKLDLAIQKFPERLTLMDALPTTAVGKVQKDKLRGLDATHRR